MTFIELKLRPAYKGKNALWSAHKLRSSSTLQYLPLFTFLLSEDKIESWIIVPHRSGWARLLWAKKEILIMSEKWQHTCLKGLSCPQEKERTLLEFSQCCKELNQKFVNNFGVDYNWETSASYFRNFCQLPWQETKLPGQNAFSGITISKQFLERACPRG